MSWKALMLLAALLLTLMLLGTGWGMGQSQAIPDDPPSVDELPDWVRELAGTLDDSRPLRIDELSGCPLEERRLVLDAAHPRAECNLAASNDGARRVLLVVEDGKLEIITRISGANVKVTLPDPELEDHPERGELRLSEDSTTLFLRCHAKSCRLLFADAQDND